MSDFFCLWTIILISEQYWQDNHHKLTEAVLCVSLCLLWITADNGGGAEKKAKVEVPEDELRAHVQNGTLAKLTVPVLKEACKQFGIQTTGAKKQELIDGLTARLCPWPI